MPKILQVDGFKFYFWPREGGEPPHIHVKKGNGNAKFWLIPEIKEKYSYGFTVR